MSDKFKNINFIRGAKYSIPLTKKEKSFERDEVIIANDKITAYKVSAPTKKEEEEYNKIRRGLNDEEEKYQMSLLKKEASKLCNYNKSREFFTAGDLPKSYIMQKIYFYSPLIILIITLIVLIVMCLSVKIPNIDWSWENWKGWGQNIQIWWTYIMDKKYWVIIIFGVASAIMFKPFYQAIKGKKNCVSHVYNLFLDTYKFERSKELVMDLEERVDKLARDLEKSKKFDYFEEMKKL